MMSWLRPITDLLRRPVFPSDEQNRKAVILHALCKLVIVVTPLYLLFGYLMPSLGLRADFAVYGRLFSCTAVMVLLRRQQLQLATQLLIGASICFVSYGAWSNGGIRAPIMLMFPALVASAGLLLDRRSVVHATVVCIVVGLIMTIAGARGLLPPPIRPPTPWASFAVLLIAMFIVSYLLRISLGVIADALERARLEIREREVAQQVLQNREIDIRQLNASLEERVVARTEQLYAAKEAAEAAGRAKGLFLAHMSHELRTPLSGLLGTIELLTKTPLTPEQQQLLQTAQLSGDSLLSVINDVLDFSKVEAGRLVLVPEQVNLRTLLEDSAAMLAENAHRNGLELVLDIDADLPPALLVDSLRIRQVVTNLLGNAIKFTTTGTVVLRASLQARHAQQAQILVEVQDTGIGIQPDELPKLFQAFAQADSSMARRFGGTGLGLVLCKRLIEAMSGTIGVNSQPGRGRTFYFTLNLAVISDSVSAVNIPLLPSAAQSVLVYGGSQLGAPATLRTLTGLMAKVEQLPTSESVLSMLHSAAADLRPMPALLVDLLPSSEEAMALIRCVLADPQLSGTAILLLCSSRDSAQLAEQNFTGVRCLIKPVRRQQLKEALRGGSVSEQSMDSVPPARDRGSSGSHRASSSSLVGTAQLLLVDDNKVNQMIAKKTLEAAGFSVDVADNGLVAVQLAAKHYYDVILMDCQMPEMDGMDATRQIRINEGNRAHVPIIALTAHALSDERARCIAAGMDDFLGKPFTSASLLAVVRKWLQPAASASA